MSAMVSSRELQSDSHIGIGTRSASMSASSTLRNDGHQNLRNISIDMKLSGAQWVGMNTTRLELALHDAMVWRMMNGVALSSAARSFSGRRNMSVMMPRAPRM